MTVRVGPVPWRLGALTKIPAPASQSVTFIAGHWHEHQPASVDPPVQIVDPEIGWTTSTDGPDDW